MVGAFVVTLLPVCFVAVLFAGGERFRHRQIDMDGEAPIHRTLFYSSKYLIVAVWAAMVLDRWGVSLSFMNVPALLRSVALCVWAAGFILLFIGRFALGSSFRIGHAKESTQLKVGGLFRFSRNPMYLGVYATLLAPILSTLNPVVLLVSTFIIAVHHRIVLAEEARLRSSFGKEYAEYCCRARRYL